MQHMEQILEYTTVREICMMAPTAHLAQKARDIIRERRDEVDVFVSNGDSSVILEMVDALVERGAKLIISRKGTKQIIEDNCSVQVVGLNNTLTDYMKMILDARVYDGLVAFFTYGALSDEVMLMCELLNVRAKNYQFTSLADCYDCVRAAIADGAVYGIGGAWTGIVSRELGFTHTILENSTESIVNALEVAQQIWNIQQEEAVKQQALRTRLETYQAVLNSTHDAIMSIDEHGIIQIVNPVAERIIGHRAEEILGQPISSVLTETKLLEVLHTGAEQTNQIMQINQTLTNTNRMPILVDNTIRGAVATFQDIKQLQSSEQKIRLKLHEKGLVAKYSFQDIWGESTAIQNTIRIAKSYASSNAAVLIYGETGVGKELFAQSIHNTSARCNGPFVAINCAAVTNNLLESELFGYEEGSFTGAAKGGRPGLFELAHGGTIFLDEIGEIPLETQVELLRVLQEKEVRRVGGSRVIPVDVRVITATNKDLIEEVSQGRFREDLYYRLNVLDLEIPPLRVRAQDTELLGLRFFSQLCCEDAPELQARFLPLLQQVAHYTWHGNIRELQNFVERVFTLLKNHTDTFDVMTEMMRRRSEDASPAITENTDQVRLQERELLLSTLAACPHSLEQASKRLGISRQTLWRKMKKHGLSSR